MVLMVFHLPRSVVCALSEHDRPCYRSHILPTAFFRNKGTKTGKRQKPVAGSPRSISHSNTVALLLSLLPETPRQTSPCRGCGQPTADSVLLQAVSNPTREGSSLRYCSSKTRSWLLIVVVFNSSTATLLLLSYSFPRVVNDLQSTYKM